MLENETFIQLASNLTEAAARNGASFISNKIKISKAKKNDKETIAELEEIISDLLNDKAEIQRIAQAYEQELVSQKITEDDIKYITDNLLPIFSEFMPNQVEIDQIKKIISVETLTIMQLIGFNYKKAIGEPLTLLLKKAIESKIPMDSQTNANYILAMARLAQDEESTRRFYQLTGQNKPNEETKTEQEDK
ncbi:MAG: hypothetical protein PUD72_05730 [Oscillospiraceae bacterium]|nr:hypothetical protein [Oscillospiraceae bacterium]